MTSQHHGRNHLRLLVSAPESSSEHRREAQDDATNVLMASAAEDLAPSRPHLFAVRQLEQEPEEPDFTQGSVEGSLSDLVAATKQGEHLNPENFQDSDFWAARRRRAAEKAGRVVGVAEEPVDPAQLGANLPTEQFPPVPPR